MFTKRITALLFCLLLALSAAACSPGAPATPPASEPSPSEPPVSAPVAPAPSGPALTAEQEEAVAVCMAAFRWVYHEDDGLNGGISLIAMDTAGLENLDQAAKEALLNAVGDETGYPVREANYAQLADEGLILEDQGNYFETGILVSLSFEMLTEDTARFTAQKFRSGLGAVGTDEGRLAKKDGAWTLDGDEMTVYIS